MTAKSTWLLGLYRLLSLVLERWALAVLAHLLLAPLSQDLNFEICLYSWEALENYVYLKRLETV